MARDGIDLSELFLSTPSSQRATTVTSNPGTAQLFLSTPSSQRATGRSLPPV